jgi:hypothetical protein
MHRWLVARWRTALAGGLVGLVPFVTYWRLWVRGPHAAHLFGDTFGLYWPDLVYLYNALSHLQLPLWNPFERGGVSMLSEPEAGVLYPVNWLLVGAGALTGGMPFVMVEVKACLHLAIGGLAMFAWLRRRGLTLPAAALGGVIYELGPYTAGNAYFAIVWPQAWLPLLMLAIDAVVEGGGPLAAMGVAGSAFLIVVAGSPPTAFYASLVAIPYFCVRAGLAARRDGWRPWLARNGPSILLAAGLAGLSCYPSVRGTFEAMRMSVRAIRTFAYVSESPLPVREWLGLLARSASRTYVYIGLPSVLLAAIGAARWRSRAESILFATLAVAGVLLMFGSATPLLGWLYAWAPPFRLFRICVRYAFLVQVAVSVLAAHGLDALSELGERPWVPRLVKRPGFATAVGTLVATVIAVDLAVTAQRAGVLHDGRFDPSSRVVSDAWLARMQAGADTERVFDEFGLDWRAGTRLGLRDLRGYVEPLAMQRTVSVYAKLGTAPEILSLFNVRWLLHAPHPVLGMSHHFVKSTDGIPGLVPHEGAVFELEDPAPVAYWVQGARVEATAADAIGRLPDLDRHGELVLAAEDVGGVEPERRIDHASRVPAVLESRTLSSLRLRVDAPSDGYLVVNEGWFPGWSATVDGRSTPVLPGNVIMQALDMPAGKHAVELRFRPAYVLYPLGAAALAWCAAVAWAVVSVRRRRTPGPTEAGS